MAAVRVVGVVVAKTWNEERFNRDGSLRMISGPPASDEYYRNAVLEAGRDCLRARREGYVDNTRRMQLSELDPAEPREDVDLEP